MNRYKLYPDEYHQTPRAARQGGFVYTREPLAVSRPGLSMSYAAGNCEYAVTGDRTLFQVMAESECGKPVLTLCSDQDGEGCKVWICDDHAVDVSHPEESDVYFICVSCRDTRELIAAEHELPTELVSES